MSVFSPTSLRSKVQIFGRKEDEAGYIRIADTATGTDVARKYVTAGGKLVSDLATGTDAVSGITVMLTITDAGTGEDRTLGPENYIEDTGTGTDEVYIRLFVTITDTGEGTDDGLMGEMLSVTDTGEGADEPTVYTYDIEELLVFVSVQSPEIQVSGVLSPKILWEVQEAEIN